MIDILGIRKELARIADCLEAFLAYNEIPMGRKADTSGEEPTATYTNEEEDFIREYEEATGVKPRIEERE